MTSAYPLKWPTAFKSKSMQQAVHRMDYTRIWLIYHYIWIHLKKISFEINIFREMELIFINIDLCWLRTVIFPSPVLMKRLKCWEMCLMFENDKVDFKRIIMTINRLSYFNMNCLKYKIVLNKEGLWLNKTRHSTILTSVISIRTISNK